MGSRRMSCSMEEEIRQLREEEEREKQAVEAEEGVQLAREKDRESTRS